MTLYCVLKMKKMKKTKRMTANVLAGIVFIPQSRIYPVNLIRNLIRLIFKSLGRIAGFFLFQENLP